MALDAVEVGQAPPTPAAALAPSPVVMFANLPAGQTESSLKPLLSVFGNIMDFNVIELPDSDSVSAVIRYTSEQIGRGFGWCG